MLEHHPVLERPRLRLVGVADQVVRALGVARDRLPLAPGRERRPAAAQQLGVRHLAQHPVGSHLHGGAQRLPAAVRPVAVDAPGIDDADARQQAQGRIAFLRHVRLWLLRQVAAAQQALHLPVRSRSRSPSRAAPGRPRSGLRRSRVSHMPRHGLSCQTARPLPGCAPSGPTRPLELRDELLRPARDTRHVGAHVRDDRRLGLEREQRVERRDAVRLRRRDREPPADVVERAPADPADARLDGVEGREQEMALRPRGMPAARHVLVALAGLRRSLPARRRAGRGRRRPPRARPPSGSSFWMTRSISGPVAPQRPRRYLSPRRALQRGRRGSPWP